MKVPQVLYVNSWDCNICVSDSHAFGLFLVPDAGVIAAAFWSVYLRQWPRCGIGSTNLCCPLQMWTPVIDVLLQRLPYSGCFVPVSLVRFSTSKFPLHSSLLSSTWMECGVFIFWNKWWGVLAGILEVVYLWHWCLLLNVIAQILEANVIMSVTIISFTLFLSNEANRFEYLEWSQDYEKMSDNRLIC